MQLSHYSHTQRSRFLTKQILDTWGSDGWELVTVIPAPGGEQLVAYMKREIK